MKKNNLVLLLLALGAVALLSGCAREKSPLPVGAQDSQAQETALEECYRGAAFVAPQIKSIQLSRSSLTLQEGAQDLLCLAVLPVDASKEGLVWSVENEEIARVSEGLVTALRQGTTAVHVKSSDGRFDLQCAVTVLPAQEQQTVHREDPLAQQPAVPQERVTLTAASGDVFPMAVAYEALQELTVLSYESENEDVVQIDSFGLVYALCPGSAVVRVHTAEQEMEVLFEVVQEQIMLTEDLPEQKSVVAGSRFSVTQGQVFEEAQGLTICSSDGAVAAVAGTDILALAKGSAQILIYQEEMLVYELFLTVTE